MTTPASPSQPSSAVQIRAIMESWLRPVEQIVLPALENKIRVLGITGPHPGAGVSTLCAAAAETLARSGAKVLLIDFSTRVSPAEVPGAWVPGEAGAQTHIRRHPTGFDQLAAVATPDTRFLFNNGKRLRRTLFEDLADYTVIVADLPPLLDDGSEHVNPLAVALACDQVLMVCANGRTPRAAAGAAAEAARAAGVRLTGVIWNDFGTPTMGRDMARSARRVFSYFPPLARFLEQRLKRSPFLNT